MDGWAFLSTQKSHPGALTAKPSITVCCVALLISLPGRGDLASHKYHWWYEYHCLRNAALGQFCFSLRVLSVSVKCSALEQETKTSPFVVIGAELAVILRDGDLGHGRQLNENANLSQGSSKFCARNDLEKELKIKLSVLQYLQINLECR